MAIRVVKVVDLLLLIVVRNKLTGSFLLSSPVSQGKDDLSSNLCWAESLFWVHLQRPRATTSRSKMSPFTRMP